MAEKIDFFEFEFPKKDGTTAVGSVMDKKAREQIEELKSGGLGTMVGATASAAGVAGATPTPQAGDQDKFLAGDGTWKSPQNGSGVSTVTLTLGSDVWTGDSAPFKYDISSVIGTDKSVLLVKFNATKGSVAQEEASNAADIQGGEDSTLYAFGDKPTVDLPVICYVF